MAEDLGRHTAIAVILRHGLGAGGAPHHYCKRGEEFRTDAGLPRIGRRSGWRHELALRPRRRRLDSVEEGDDGTADHGVVISLGRHAPVSDDRASRAPRNGYAAHRHANASPRDDDASSDLALLELIERAGHDRVALDQLTGDLLVRLHTRSDDYSATKALQAVRAAAARLESDVVHSPAPTIDRRVRAPVRFEMLLQVAIAVTVAWLLVHHHGTASFLLAGAVAVVVVVWARISRSAMDRWPSASSAAWATTPLLAILNLLVALALFDGGTVSTHAASAPTIAAFVSMGAVNLVVLRAAWAPSRAEACELPPSYVDVVLDPGCSATVDPNGNGHRRDETDRQPRELNRRERVGRALAIGAGVAAAAWIAYTHPGGPLLVLVALAIGVAIPFTTDVDRDRAIKMVLAVAVAVATLDYIGWRIAVANWSAAWMSVPLLWAEVFGAVHLLGFQLTIWPRKPPAIESLEDPTTHPVYIFVPTVNEGTAVVRPTIEGCLAARARYVAQFPDASVTIVICNDGRAAGAPDWHEIEALACELDVDCVTRPVKGGAKAGNIENARREFGVTGDALLVIFDADQVPQPEFLLETIPPFADPTVGWVQTGQYYANLDNPVSRWADDQQSMFYNLLCPGKAAMDAAFICGTNVVIRAVALDEIGGLPQDSVTEDFAASIVLHPRWRSIYLNQVLATGLGPLDLPSYLKQQRRWALGTLGVFRTRWRDIFLPKKGGLRLGQRVQYFLACTHYLCGLRDLLFIVIPILFVFTGVPAVRTATLSDYLWHFLPYAILAIAAMWYAARRVTGLRGVVIGFGSFPALLGSLAAVITGRKSGFAVTSKASQRTRSLRYLVVYIVLTAACIVALFWATRTHVEHQASLFISVLWISYSLLLLGAFLWLAAADARLHRTERADERERRSTGKLAYSSRLIGHPTGLRPVWCLGLAAVLATPLLINARVASLRVFGTPDAPAFAMGADHSSAPYTGLSLPVQLLRTAPPHLEREVGVRFSIIGRTQDVGDNFDRGWADHLADHGARPWITLQFGEFGRGHKAPLDANLPAIVNGVRDGDLRRWAREIRDFGRPVYLTVFLHADKNWSVSSGVAHGGIPADVPKAWTHVQSVFRDEGADNVAWVWAPADPVNDREFAPPPSSIDAVLQSFINYPGTQWGDPQAVLGAVTARYPDKPLFVEASAAGPAAQKAAWLARLAWAVDDSPGVYAVLYHEGGPDLTLSSTTTKEWSLASDAQSLASVQRLMRGLRSAGSDG